MDGTGPAQRLIGQVCGDALHGILNEPRRGSHASRLAAAAGLFFILFGGVRLLVMLLVIAVAA